MTDTTTTADAPAFTTLRATVDADRPGVGRLTLSRPDRLNPLGTVTLREIIDAAAWFDAIGTVVVVVTGEGRAFSAGYDLRDFAAAADDADRGPDGAELGAMMADAVEQMRAITIAAVKGPCIGGGVVLAGACDLRIAADDSLFMIPELDLGIPLTWGGIPRLVREVGPAAARDLVLTGRGIGAEEARSLGLVTRVVPRDALEREADALAATMAAKAPSVLRTTKRQFADAVERSVPAAGAWAEAALTHDALHTRDAREARSRYLASRSSRA